MPPANVSSRTALLVFADAVSADLRRRGWSARFAPLLRLPRFVRRGVTGCDVHLFTNEPDAIDRVTVHHQNGLTFGERLCAAVECLATAGYERIVIVGRDCPQLTSDDVRVAAAALETRRLVLGPDRRGGCYLIALHARDRALLREIPWQRDVDRAALQRAFGPARTLVLAAKRDLDDVMDVRLLAIERPSWSERLRRLFEPSQVRDIDSNVILPPLPVERQRERWQRPPPATSEPPLLAA